MTRTPILGQEAITRTRGLGRVTSLDGWPKHIWVECYADRYPLRFDVKNVRLVKINVEDAP